jgi:inhibitor of KinA sporulation pathway (predicted exonuclease)
MRLVAIDFEATCDEPYNPDPQEIIEFPAVLVDSANSQSAEFHSYVRPVAHPRLTPFCVNLTGIQQAVIDRASAFPEVLRCFEEWRAATCPDALVVHRVLPSLHRVLTSVLSQKSLT